MFSMTPEDLPSRRRRHGLSSIGVKFVGIDNGPPHVLLVLVLFAAPTILRQVVKHAVRRRRKAGSVAARMAHRWQQDRCLEAGGRTRIMTRLVENFSGKRGLEHYVDLSISFSVWIVPLHSDRQLMKSLFWNLQITFLVFDYILLLITVSLCCGMGRTAVVCCWWC